MKRVLWLAARIVLVVLIAVYLIDWGTLRVKIAHGTGYGSVQVDEYLSTPLKNHKDEYDYMGSQPEPCSHSIFPHGAAPCWWLARHTTQWE
ncbi:MAG: hypothetical protein WAM66_14710 [Acidobacteriaceae bacterium]